MKRIFSIRNGISLRLKILIPLITISFFVFIIAFLFFHQFLFFKFEAEINKRAETIASTLIYYNDVTDDANQIQRLVSTLDLETDVENIIIVSDNPPRVLASTHIQWVNKKLSLIPDLPERSVLQTACFSSGEFIFRNRTSDSFIYVTSLRVMPSGNAQNNPGKGGLYIELNIKSSVRDLSRLILLFALGLFVSTLLVALLLYQIISRIVLIPASAISHAMMKRAKGETSVRVRLYSKDEIGGIAQSLNEMLDQLDKESSLRSQVENQLRESETKLRELNTTKDRFFSIIAHDLKSPFNAILGFSKLLQEDYDQFSKEEHLKFMSRINDGLTNLYSLLENLLDWSRIQLGHSEIKPESLDLGLLVFEVAGSLKLTMEKKGIRAQVEIPDNTLIFSDENMIKTVLRNLISNAIKFSHSGKTIRISVMNPGESGDIPPGFMGVSVIDQGVGIPKNSLGSLFRIDSVYRAKGTDKEPGTGLGLILCKEFIEKLGGKIWAESEEGKGSAFIFTLPLS